MKHTRWLSAFLLVLLASMLTPLRARADVAPPEQPPGASIVPGRENTQVRMIAETVTLTVLPKPATLQLAQATTEAVFTMRNLGTETETMQARFPLTFWNDRDDGFGNFPEISDIKIFVNGNGVPTQRINADFTGAAGVAYQQAPWAAFDVSFPPNSDVTITVRYTSNGYGYEPNVAFRYILETGAGWHGTIGSADVVVKLPYPASEENVIKESESVGFGETSPGMQMVENTVRWHFEDFEPTAENNISVLLAVPSYWQKVLDWRAHVEQDPNDGEIWGQLGKAIKEVNRASKGYPREDAGGQKLYQEAVLAYEKAVTLLPNDALWHYGFADLLWTHTFFANMGKPTDVETIARLASALNQSLTLNPKDQKVKDLADEVSRTYPWAIRQTDDGYDYPVLTATPTNIPATVTPSPEASSTPQPQIMPTQTPPPVTATDAPLSPTPAPQAGLPLCGGAGAIVLPALAAFWFASKKTILRK